MATGSIPVGFWVHQLQANALCCNALHGIASHRAASKSKAGAVFYEDQSRWAFEFIICIAEHSVALHGNANKINAPRFGGALYNQPGETTMAIETLRAEIVGKHPLLMANPQTVDRFNPYAKEMARINAKKTRRTDEDYRMLADIEVRAKIHWDDELGVFVPTTWLMAALCKNGFALKKISRDKIRGSVFPTETKVALKYQNDKLVETLDDVTGNPFFRHSMNIKQGQVRVMKSMPIFHNWSFSTTLEFENTQVDYADLKAIIEYSAKYGGFGDFRPTFGRASAEVTR